MSIVPRIKSNYKILTDTHSLKLDNKNGDYKEIASLAHLGILYNCTLEFNTTYIQLKLVIDEQTVFEVNLRDILYITKGTKLTNSVFRLDTNENAFMWVPSYPVMVKQSVQIFARASNTSNSKYHYTTLLEYSDEG